MTPEELTQLGIDAAIAFPTAETFEHWLAGDCSYDEVVKCGKCDKVMYDCRSEMDDWWKDEFKQPCTVPTPLPIDWATAHRLFRAAWMERGWRF